MKRFLHILTALAAAVIPARGQDYTSGLQAHFPLNESTGFSCTDQVSGLTSTITWYGQPPTWLNPGLRFFLVVPGNTADQWIVPNLAPSLPAFPQMTISAWAKLEGSYWSTVLEAGNSGKFFAGMMNGKMFFATNWYGGGAVMNYSNASVPAGEWVHLTWAWNGTTLRFYINGVKDTNEPAVSFTFDRDLLMGWRWKGGMRDVRLYNRDLTNADINALRAVPPPLFPPAYAGLWTGSISLNEVKEATSGAWAPTPAAFSENILLHIDSAGNARVLGEATIMKTRVTPPVQPVQVIVTQPGLLANFDGITPRGSRMTGQRFSSSTFAVPAAGQILADGTGGWLTGTWTMDANAPGNPFRHKYHPDLATGRTLVRTVWFHSNPGDSPSDHTFTTTFYEGFTGLHKTMLEARGPVTFTRVSTSGKLNQP